MDVFETCREVNNLLSTQNETAARNLLIRLLAELDRNKTPYSQLVNHMIRGTGLFPYLQLENASWDQKYVHQAFEIDVGRRVATLHREQSNVLAKLLSGDNIAVSAPTSFGKSFIIDAFIAAKHPKNVVIIVPTIALMDETRRRLFKKFSEQYSIITAPETRLGNRNILIFPQERAFGYLSSLETIDLLVVDEFYKASQKHDRDRAPSLIKAILKLSKKAKQRYYLAPNIKKLNDNAFTRDMEFIELLDFNTVYLEVNELYKSIKNDEIKKGETLIEIISQGTQKSLVYAGTYTEIDKISKLIIKKMPIVDRIYTSHFANWIRQNYQPDWELADLAERAVGVHNGNMHRCLSQLQVKLFEYDDGFDSIVSTSSIIEGVNTSAQNVVIWKSKLGGSNLKDFTYKNIIGRGGRMFKYFVGNIYLLDAPPKNEDTQLEIEFPEEILGTLDEDQDSDRLTDLQVDRIVEFRYSMTSIIGEENFSRVRRENLLQDSDADFLLRLASDMKDSPDEWRGFGYLNSKNPNDWENMLYRVLRLKPGNWDTQYNKLVSVTKAISQNWEASLPEVISSLRREGISINDFFKLERTITFKLSALLSDTNELHRMIIDPSTDISPLIGRMSRAFLPGAVYHLEEYGLPRMISKKIHSAGLINFQDPSIDLQESLERFKRFGIEEVLAIRALSSFDRYIVKFFYDGITPDDLINS
ncbi:DEAD/DEAH box helicase [Leisingera caerulea]|uniref:DEAD/DEAH box helicase n=1 Tax=Leisingera caerulea TaxID=506591 RepID=UPI0021A968E1|nr:DEAD/DEAH box helicase [Leisingera caerulea]UWQ84763.1 DEAD/DEAH box helicase [Leisingera caerulea]